MTSVYFMGAGTRAAAGYPITKWLTYPVAHYLCRYRRENNKQPSRLEEYLSTTYSTTIAGLQKPSKLWTSFVNSKQARVETLPDHFMPNIIEILSIIEIAIADDWSFGPRGFVRPGRKRRQFKGNELKHSLRLPFRGACSRLPAARGTAAETPFDRRLHSTNTSCGHDNYNKLGHASRRFLPSLDGPASHVS